MPRAQRTQSAAREAARPPGQRTGRGQVQRLVRRPIMIVPVTAARALRLRSCLGVDARSARRVTRLSARGACSTRSVRRRQRRRRRRHGRSLLTTSDVDATSQRFKNAVACGGAAAASHLPLALMDFAPASSRSRDELRVRRTDLTLSCAAKAHVPKPKRRGGLPRMTFEEPSRELQPP